ncbi:MAG TPA: twin-arginine translocation signal domain-containing protein [Nocardioidaceae bacterium]|nr:twin-arginine translocation signal domain-containing protein [Nocardioidaceae bacterium]
MGSAGGAPFDARAHHHRTSPISRRAFLALAAAGAAATACSSGPHYPTYAFPKQALYYGAATPPDRLARFEAHLGSQLSCYRSFFLGSDVGRLHQRVVGDLAAGRMPIASIKPPGPWAATARNRPWIDSLVGPLSDVGAQVFLCVHHEPENDAANYGTPADYIAMQDAVLAAASTTPNVVVVPILGSWSFDERSKRRPSEWNVRSAGVYGLDIYNPWSPTNGKEWIAFADKLALGEDEADGRPMLIGEYGCRSDAAQPGRAATWLGDAFDAALDAGVVAMAYFNSDRNSPDGSWELDSETLPEFARLMKGPDVAWVKT